MPKVSDAHRASRRDQIVAAATRVMADRGVRVASMSDIIEASGLSAGAIYLQFESKQEILLEVARRALADRLQILDARVPAPGAPFTDLLVELIGGDRLPVPASVPLQLWGEAAVDEQVRGIVQEVFASFAAGWTHQLRLWATVERGMGEAEATAWAQELAPVALGLAQGGIVQSAIRDDFDLERYLAAAEPLFAGPVATDQDR